METSRAWIRPPEFVEGFFAEGDISMPKAYSMDLRKRVTGGLRPGIAHRPDSEATHGERIFRRKVAATAARARYARTQTPRQQRYPTPLTNAVHAVDGAPHLTLEGLREKLGVKVHLSTLGYRLERLGLTFKKTPRASEQAREDLRVRSYAWRETQPMLDPARLVFLALYAFTVFGYMTNTRDFFHWS
ncbi:hypothetical protein METHB2_480014 [Candidatus Methylobacter favarea]|uniref:Winged helix-turn helix domain-containing protein n=1 Tax=Candidatus Methylobacter favarea TaxID=2707345 RepID=A0A8S0XJZ1_9GAMM|nr:hypothetical protein [Candidatus Methylobacter favarea]CAA9891680.1 hypothetical protein METHB2_480014 [Candidatus Methylobacter favarea]